MALFLILSGFDPTLKLPDPFRDFKLAWVGLLAAPIIFFQIRHLYHWSAAYVVAYFYAFWVVHKWLPYSMVGLIHIVAALAVGVFVLRKIPIRWVENVIMLSASLEAVFGILNKCGYYFVFRPARPEDFLHPMGTWGQHTILGAFLAACLPVALWRRNWVSVALIVAGAYVCHSTMTLASIGAVFMIYTWFKTSFKTMAYAIFVMFLIVFTGWLIAPRAEIFSLTGRQVFWPQGWQAFLFNPWMGSGLGSWQSLWIPYKFGAIDQAGHAAFKLHNEYLQGLVEGGVALMLPIGYAILQFAKSFKPTWYHAMVVAVLVNSIGNFPLHLPGISLLFIVAFGYTIGVDKRL